MILELVWNCGSFMKILANDIRVGHILEHEGRLCLVLKKTHTQPGKGGAYVVLEMKDVKSGTKLDVRYRSGEFVVKANLDQRKYQYLYTEDTGLAVMDKDTFEQISVPVALVGEDLPFLREGDDVTVEFYNETPVSVILPETGVFEIVECEPVVKGQTATSSYKPAMLDNGERMSVPQFINVGDKVVIKIEERKYLERAK